MQREVLHKLGDYLLAHRDEIVGEWLRAIEQNRDMTAPTHLEYDELVDHLPEFCQELSELLNYPAGGKQEPDFWHRATPRQVSLAARLQT